MCRDTKSRQVAGLFISFCSFPSLWHSTETAHQKRFVCVQSFKGFGPLLHHHFVPVAAEDIHPSRGQIRGVTGRNQIPHIPWRYTFSVLTWLPPPRPHDLMISPPIGNSQDKTKFQLQRSKFHLSLCLMSKWKFFIHEKDIYIYIYPYLYVTCACVNPIPIWGCLAD